MKHVGRNWTFNVTMIIVVAMLNAGVQGAPEWSTMKPVLRVVPQKGTFSLCNGRCELQIDTAEGLNPRSLRDSKTGRVYADANYVWPNNTLPPLIGEPEITKDAHGSYSVTFHVKCNQVDVYQTFTAPANEPDVIEETIRLYNSGTQSIDIPDFKCGFAKQLPPDLAAAEGRFTAIPSRVHTETGELCDYSAADIVSKKNRYSTVRSPIYNRQDTSLWGSEGWAWYSKNESLLLLKYNPESMEWSLLEPLRQSSYEGVDTATGGQVLLKFGGAGRWKLGDPEGAAHLEPGRSFTFGVTCMQMLDGGWEKSFAAFRSFMESKGHCLPPNYDQPVHWNELYDNPLWWVGDTLENRTKYYQRTDMQVEAEKAKELGCQCLYLDPGWDTSFGSNIWAKDRLGTQPEFVQWLKDKYQMPLALHTPLAPWSDVSEYPQEARRMNQDGARQGELCCASPAYIHTKVERLLQLCKDGAYFLMFDGSWFAGQCWDKSHNHALPVTHQEHIDAIRLIAQRVHAAYPNVVIEQHDPMTGPGTPRYAPTYILHGKKGDFDELWGYEYMIDPMADIDNRLAMSLYYYNLAYSIPMYLHIDLRKDNENALMFWWYASTCRHLGIGGKHPDGNVWQAHKNAMQTYLRLKPFFSSGRFYGLDEQTHVHTLKSQDAAVVNCFNFQTTAVSKNMQINLSEMGLKNTGDYKVVGAESWQRMGDILDIKLQIPARAAALVELSLSK